MSAKKPGREVEGASPTRPDRLILSLQWHFVLQSRHHKLLGLLLNRSSVTEQIFPSGAAFVVLGGMSRGE
jgi:hypothetical protein